MGYMDVYKSWLDSAYIDDATKEELRRIQGNEKEIEDRFYKDLEFGTGGLRGVIGAGTNRLNIYTVRKGWRLLLIPDICLRNFLRKRLCV